MRERKKVPIEHLGDWRNSVDGGKDAVTVVTGSFHTLQPGNLQSLIAAGRGGRRRVCVLLDDDESLKKRFPDRPIGALAERIEAMTFFKDVSAVAMCRQGNIEGVLSGLAPYTLVHCPARDDGVLAAAAANKAAARLELPLLQGCSTSEVLAAIKNGATPLVVPRMAATRRNQSGADGSVTTVNGCFDVIHIGHLRFLEEAGRVGGRLVILVNSDSSVCRYKGNDRPIFPLRFRRQALLAVEGVSSVLSFAQNTPLKLIEKIKPAVHVKGGSYEPDRVEQEAGLLREWGGRIMFCSMVSKYSTSHFVNRIKST